MSKELVKAAYAEMGTIIPFEGEGMLEKVMEWNKDGNYPYTPIHIEITDTGIEDNSQDIKLFTDKVEAYIEDVCKNALDLDEVTAAKKMAAAFSKYLNKTRIAQTAPFKDTVSNYTEQEGRYEGFGIKLKAKENAINTKLYEKRAESIRELILEIIAEKELQKFTHLDMFMDFIENKKKTNIYTSTGKLSKGIKDAATQAIETAAAPIIAAQEKANRETLQTAQYEQYISNIEVVGSKDKLEANIVTLERLRESVENLYPDITEYCDRSINNKITLIQANMRADEAMAAKKEQDDIDGKLLEKAEAIQEKAKDLTLSSKELKEMKDELSDIYVQLTLAKSQGQVKNLGVSLGKRIVDAEAREHKPTPILKKEVPQEEASYSAFKYVIASADIEEFDSMVVEANSEKEAIEKFTQVFRNHLSMVGLIKVEE